MTDFLTEFGVYAGIWSLGDGAEQSDLRVV